MESFKFGKRYKYICEVCGQPGESEYTPQQKVHPGKCREIWQQQQQQKQYEKVKAKRAAEKRAKLEKLAGMTGQGRSRDTSSSTGSTPELTQKAIVKPDQLGSLSAVESQLGQLGQSGQSGQSEERQSYEEHDREDWEHIIPVSKFTRIEETEIGDDMPIEQGGARMLPRRLRLYVWQATSEVIAAAQAVNQHQARDIVAREIWGDDWREQYARRRDEVGKGKAIATGFEWLFEQPKEMAGPAGVVLRGMMKGKADGDGDGDGGGGGGGSGGG